MQQKRRLRLLHPFAPVSPREILSSDRISSYDAPPSTIATPQRREA